AWWPPGSASCRTTVSACTCGGRAAILPGLGNRRPPHEHARRHRRGPRAPRAHLLPPLRPAPLGDGARGPGHVRVEVLQLREAVRPAPRRQALMAAARAARALARVVVPGLAVLLGACAKPEDLRGSDAHAVQVASQVMQSLGGKAAWDTLCGIRWTFGAMVNDSVRSSRRHAWDKKTGWHRVEGVNRLGQTFCIIHTVGDTTNGMAWVNGNPIQGDSLHKLIKRGEAMWVNDTYWMLMPYKLRDPGVTLKDDGDTTIAGVRYDRLALSFANVGLTPGDHYWVFVDRANHRVERWEMVLQGDQPPPRGYTWEGWEQHDGLWFPTAHRSDSTNVFTNKIETVHAFAATEFTQP